MLFPLHIPHNNTYPALSTVCRPHIVLISTWVADCIQGFRNLSVLWHWASHCIKTAADTFICAAALITVFSDHRGVETVLEFLLHEISQQRPSPEYFSP